MAVKKFAQMSTKKLNALLETASDEDRVAIQAILDARAEKQTATVAELSDEEKQAMNESEGSELSDEEEQAIKNAEVNTPKTKNKSGRKASPKLSEEELLEAEKQAKENVGHRCTVLLPGTAIQVNGTIITTLKDKRAMRVYYVIETDAVDDMESRKIYKKFGSDEINVLDEVVELKKKTASKARVAKAKKDAGEWEAEAHDIMAIASQNVGKVVELPAVGTGRIVSLLNDKRSNGIYYRIEAMDENGIKKTKHKIINYSRAEDGSIVLAEYPEMMEELDERGLEINQAYQERKTREPRKVLTPEEKVLACEEAVEKAKITLEKARETLIMRETALEIAKSELNAKFDAQETLASGNDEEDLA